MHNLENAEAKEGHFKDTSKEEEVQFLRIHKSWFATAPCFCLLPFSHYHPAASLSPINKGRSIATCRLGTTILVSQLLESGTTVH